VNLSPQERLLIERELIAKEAVRERRRLFFGKIFWIGVSVGGLSGFIRGFSERERWISALFALGYVICASIYTEFIGLPRSFMQDADIRWHLNPWEEMLSRIKDEQRLNRTVVLLFVPVMSMIAGMLLRKLLE
jgi:hypothetical protein